MQNDGRTAANSTAPPFIPHSHLPDKVIKHPSATYICTKKTKAGNAMVKRRSYKAAIKKLRPFVIGAVAGTVTAAVFTVIGAFLFNIAAAPSGADRVMAYVSLGASAVVCGMFFGGGRGKNGFAWGTLGGLAMFALCFAVTLISGGFTGTEFLPKLISSALSGCIGGIIGVNIAAER